MDLLPSHGTLKPLGPAQRLPWSSIRSGWRRELLERAGVEHEPVVMLERTDAGALVRKLTVAEKLDHAERTGENVFFGSDKEFDEAVLAVPYEGTVLGLAGTWPDVAYLRRFLAVPARNWAVSRARSEPRS